jgi:hypothetical protein
MFFPLARKESKKIKANKTNMILDREKFRHIAENVKVQCGKKILLFSDQS